MCRSVTETVRETYTPLGGADGGRGSLGMEEEEEAEAEVKWAEFVGGLLERGAVFHTSKVSCAYLCRVVVCGGCVWWLCGGCVWWLRVVVVCGG